jgi:hypothetical protein
MIHLSRIIKFKINFFFFVTTHANLFSETASSQFIFVVASSMHEQYLYYLQVWNSVHNQFISFLVLTPEVFFLTMYSKLTNYLLLFNSLHLPTFSYSKIFAINSPVYFESHYSFPSSVYSFTKLHLCDFSSTNFLSLFVQTVIDNLR